MQAESLIKQEKKVEDRTAALLRTLTERADLWGRRRLSFVTRETSSEVGKLIGSQSKLLQEINTAYDRLVESAKARVKKAMDQLQVQLSAELCKLGTDKRAAVDKVFSEFRPKLEEQETRLREVNINVPDTVGKFTSRIRGMSLQDLERIADGKSVQITEPMEGGREWSAVVICPDVEGP
jgi:hypothetical protein